MGIAQKGASLHCPAAAAHKCPHTHCCSWCCRSERHTSRHSSRHALLLQLIPRQGTLQAEADAHSRQLVERAQFMRNAAQEAGLLQLPSGATLPEGTVAQFSQALAAKLEDLSAQLSEVKANNRWGPATQERQAVCPADEVDPTNEVCIC